MEGAVDTIEEQDQMQNLLRTEVTPIHKVTTKSDMCTQSQSHDADLLDDVAHLPSSCADTDGFTDGGHGWVVVASSFFSLMIVGGHYMTFGLLYPAISEHYNVPYGVSGWVGSLSVGTIHLFGKYWCQIYFRVK